MLITKDTRYLVIPTRRGAKKTTLSLFSDELLLDLDAEVDFIDPETVFYYDLKPYMGLDVQVRHESGRSFGFSAKKPTAFDHTRPKLHFTAERGWINDPNGLCRYEGRWQLFFQHNPIGLGWGNMHWGHAVSDDLVHWEELGDLLYPDGMGDMFSGSAIVDSDNLLGLKENGHDTLVLFYTAAGGSRRLSAGQPFTQCMAYSTDGGETFRKWAGNPVVPHIKGGNRDPKVVRDPESGVYVMSLYLDGDEYALLTSQNLAEWKQLQTVKLPGDNECPDFCPMRDSDGRLRWVLLGAHDCVLVGDFDPERGFVPDGGPSKLGFGRTYAAQSFSLGDDLRRVRLSWNRFGELGSRQFTGALSVPCELTLEKGSLRIAPAEEFDAALTAVEDSAGLPFRGTSRRVDVPCDITLELSKLEETAVIALCGIDIRLEPTGQLSVNGETMPMPPVGESFGVRLILDRTGLEVFDTAGRVFGSFAVIPSGDRLTLGGEGSLDRLIIRVSK